MAPPSIIKKLAVCFFLFASMYSQAQVVNKKPIGETGQNENKDLVYDTSTTAIIQLSGRSRWPFDSSFKAAVLTQNELEQVDSFLIVCVTDYNNLLDKDHKQWGIDLVKRNYRKQLIVVTNKNGEKEVWVNCFCQVDNDRWKTREVGIDDGGNCYFNFKINLTTKRYYDLGVNGIG